MGKRPGARTLSLGAAALLAVGLAAVPTTAADAAPAKKFSATSVPSGKTFTGAKSRTGQIAKSNPHLVGRTDRRLTNVMVKLDVDPAASYRGDLRGYAATSPSVTGKKYAKSSAATQSYVRHVNAYASNAAGRIRAAVPLAKVLRTFSTVYGGLLVRLPANRAKDLLKVKGVVAVQSDTLNHPLADTNAAGDTIANDTTRFVGANKVWPNLGGQARAGHGVIVGVLDTGIWPEHPMVRDTGLSAPAGGPWGCEFGDGSDPALGAPFTCNNKLIGAYAFLDTNLAVNGGATDGQYCDSATGECSARDSDGHGTHTSTTAAGDRVNQAKLLGVDRGPISGMAPGASVIMYRVCLDNGCYSSDSVAAVQQAVEDGVDVINFSISGGANAYSDPVELAFLDAYAASVSVSASAGNSGPGNATAEHAGPWVTTVGASTSDRAFQSRLVLTASDGSRYAKTGATITDGVTNKPVVDAARVRGYRDALCQTPFPAGSVTNKVVLCQRGVNARVDKGYNALQGGAAGMILYNLVKSDVETDNHWLPAVHLDGPNSALLSFVGSHTGIRASWAQGQKATVRGDVMAGFSSRGPVGDFLKPDVTAPGIQVLAGNTPTPIETTAGPPGQYYQAIAGTSMSSPHSAGISALVKASHPTWTAGQIKSALMTSSLQDVINADGSTAGPWDRGAGSIRANRAVSPTLTFNVSPTAYYDAANDPLHRVDLNLPSINVDPLPGAITTPRTVRNMSGQTQTFTVSSISHEGVQIDVTPSTFTLAPNRKQRMQITIDGSAAQAGWHFAEITIRSNDPGSIDAVVPVAVNSKSASVTLSQKCDPTSVLVRQKSTCTVKAQNNAPVESQTRIDVRADSGVSVTNVSPPAHQVPHGAAYSGTLSPSLAPEIESITPGGSPAGYLPLSSFGIDPQPGIGDETITNFGVPSFQYGGETYDTVGVDSNGYVVVGGGTSTDNECCTIPPFPSPVRPNNVIAPLWTDLSFDPASGGGDLRAALLGDGTNNYLVVDYDQVKTYGNGGSGRVNSFEVWLELGSSEGVWMTYGTLNGVPAGQDTAYGAENRDGTSGVNIAAPSSDSDYTVNAGSPTPGGSVEFTYQAASNTAGSYTLLASLKSSIVRGTTTDRTELKVNK